MAENPPQATTGPDKDQILEKPLAVTLLSRQDCHLCDVTMKIARRLQEGLPFTLTKIDIDQDADLSERYGLRIQVVLIDGRVACEGKITEGGLRRALKRARWRRPISRILSRLGWTP
jgi:hypothetical protein